MRDHGLAFCLRALLLMGIAFVPPAFAQTSPASPAPKAKAASAKSAPGAPFAGFGSNSKEPIKIDANKLEVFDKENRAIFTGDVVAIQGQTTMRCSVMTVIYNQNKDQRGTSAAQKASAPAATPTAGAAAQSSIKQIDCIGPVSLLSGTQSATSDKLVYEADKDIVTLTGKVVIADCDNVQRGERVVYDVKTGRATVDAGAGGRVQGVFTPGSDDKKAANANAKECGAAPPKPATPAARPATAPSNAPKQLLPNVTR